MSEIKVGLLGCGNVGSSVIKLLSDSRRQDALGDISLKIVRVGVRSLDKQREVDLDPALLTDDPFEVVNDPLVDIIVEVIGGVNPAKDLILAAIKNKKPVVTGNKELLANCGSELWEAADAYGVDLLFEAAVAGGIPLIRMLRESLAAERVQRVSGILNGTTNYILTKMTEEKTQFSEALSQAQQLGYAEADATADIDGSDAAAKAAIIANIAFGAKVVLSDVYKEGIGKIDVKDISFAHRHRCVIKSIAVVENLNEDPIALSVRVHPALIPIDHPLASVRDSFNAIFVEGEAVGELMFSGRGAGGLPTASAVVGDLLDAAHNFSSGSSGRFVPPTEINLVSPQKVRSAFYLALDVIDEPGVLQAVSGVLGDNRVSARLVEQDADSHLARLALLTHTCTKGDIDRCIEQLKSLSVVKEIKSTMWVQEA